METSETPPRVFSQLFDSLVPRKECPSCMHKTKAFDKPICRLGKPEIKGMDCPFWRKWKA